MLTALIPALVAVLLLLTAYRWHLRFWFLGSAGWGQVYAGLGLLLVGGVFGAFAVWTPTASVLTESVTLDPAFIARVVEAAGLALAVYGGMVRLRPLAAQQRRLKEQQSAYDLYESLRDVAAQPYSLLEIIDYSIKEMVRGQDAEAGGIWLLNPARRQWVLAGSAGLTQAVQQQLERVDGGVHGFDRLLHTGRPRVINDADVLTEWFPELPVSRFGSVLALPLVSSTGEAAARDVLGVMLLCGGRGRFAPRDVKLVGAAADFLSAVLAEAKSGRKIAAVRGRLAQAQGQLDHTVDLVRRLGDLRLEAVREESWIAAVAPGVFQDPRFVVGRVQPGAGEVSVLLGGAIEDAWMPVVVGAARDPEPARAELPARVGSKLVVETLGDGWFQIAPVGTTSMQSAVLSRWCALVDESIRDAELRRHRDTLAEQVNAVRDVVRIIGAPESADAPRSLIESFVRRLLGDQWYGLVRMGSEESPVVVSDIDAPVDSKVDLSVQRWELSLVADECADVRLVFGREELTAFIGEEGVAASDRRCQGFGMQGAPVGVIWIPLPAVVGDTPWVCLWGGEAAVEPSAATVDLLRDALVAIIGARSRLPSREVTTRISRALESVADEIGGLNRELGSGMFLDLDAIGTRVSELRGRIGSLRRMLFADGTDAARIGESRPPSGLVDLQAELAGWAGEACPGDVELSLLAPTGLRVACEPIRAILRGIGRVFRSPEGSDRPLVVTSFRNRDGVVFAISDHESDDQELEPMWEYPANGNVQGAAQAVVDLPLEDISQLGCRVRLLTQRDGRAARVEVLFPMETAVDDTGQSSVTVESRMTADIAPVPDEPGQSPVSILILEETESMRELVEGLVESMGFAAVSCSDVRRALILLDNSPSDLIIAGLPLRNGAGSGFVGEVRSRWPQIPLIGITESESPLVEEDRLARLLHIPYRLQELEEAIRGVLVERERAAPVGRGPSTTVEQPGV